MMGVRFWHHSQRPISVRKESLQARATWFSFFLFGLTFLMFLEAVQDIGCHVIGEFVEEHWAVLGPAKATQTSHYRYCIAHEGIQNSLPILIVAWRRYFQHQLAEGAVVRGGVDDTQFMVH